MRKIVCGCLIRLNIKGSDDRMGIQEEIFEGFFKKLEDDEDFPDSIVEELKRLWESSKIASQEKILEVVERGSENVSKNQND